MESFKNLNIINGTVVLIYTSHEKIFETEKALLVIQSLGINKGYQ